jgi:hypothetical protein
MSEERNSRLESTDYLQNPTLVEVVTDKFRAVAVSFYMLPAKHFIGIQAAISLKNGTELGLLFDAAKIAFDDDAIGRLEGLGLIDFQTAISAWINAGQGGKN